MNISQSKIGIFDSGVGGLSVWKEIVKILPHESIIYYADSNNCPYGTKSQDEVIELSKKIVDFLLNKDCKIIVVACNTATAAAIDYLRSHYKVPFVGMEPAVKPAAMSTKTDNIGILATHGTFQGRLFQETSKKWADGKKLMIQEGEGLVELVEQGKADSEEAEVLLKKYLLPMLENNVDQIVLGCTHYPFLLSVIEKIVKGKATIIDPAPAVAKRTFDLLQESGNINLSRIKADYEFYINGNKKNITNILEKFSIKNDYRIFEI